MEILYQDANILVCIKPARVLSTDEPGGLPELVREALGDPKADVRTVHRLDRVVSGVMVLARMPARRRSCPDRFGKTSSAKNIWPSSMADRKVRRGRFVTCWRGTRQDG